MPGFLTSPPMVGLMGKARAGKDTVADIIVAEYGYRKIAFAAPVYQAALAVNPLLPMNNEFIRLNELITSVGWDVAKEYNEVRRILQVVGTELGREILGEDCWLDIAFRKASMSDEQIVFSDVRFLNEAEAISRENGYVIEVIRHGTGLAGARGSHASETQSAEIKPDFIISNNGSLNDLRSRVLTTMNAIANRVPRLSQAET